MKTQWKLIPKDKWGLFEAEDEEFYNDLPCVVYNEDEEYPCYEIIDKNNYGDWTHHLSKQQYKWYLPFPEKKKGGKE